MNAFRKFLIILATTSVMITACAITVAVKELDALGQQVTAANDEAIRKSMEFAPKGKSIFQLRGDAQTEAQRLLDKLTKKYNMSRYELSGIRWKPVLETVGTAASVPPCETRKRIISLNEILFLRNYEEYMNMIIPHEVAHIMTCLQGGYADTAHGEEWIRVMYDLGFKEPEKYITHELDLTPVHVYELDLEQRLKQGGSNEISEE